MRKLNLVVVFNKDLSKSLFCIRAKEPYKGLYNFVGGKVEENETNDAAAYRELFEETGIGSTTLTKLNNNEIVSMAVMIKICEALHCNIGEVMDIIYE